MTVTAQVAVFAPSTVVTVIVALPTPTPPTAPVVVTEAIVESLEDHSTFVFVAVEGWTKALSCAVPPTRMVAVAGLIDTPVTGFVVSCRKFGQPTKAAEQTTAPMIALSSFRFMASLQDAPRRA